MPLVVLVNIKQVFRQEAKKELIINSFFCRIIYMLFGGVVMNKPFKDVKSKQEIRDKRIRDIRIKNENTEKEFVFNKKRSDYILDLDHQGKFYTCLKEINKYFQDYPFDPNIFLLYSIIQKRVGNYGESRRFLEAAKTDPALAMAMPAQLVSAELSLLIREDRYQEALDLLNEKEDVLVERNAYVGVVRNYLNIQLGNEPTDTGYEELYTNKQVVNYDETLLYDHLQKHIYDSETIIEQETVFNPKINIHDLVELVKSHLYDIEPFHSSFFLDIVYFKYKNAGICDGKHTSIIKVIFIRGTDHIITMFPCINPDNFPTVDITPELHLGNIKRTLNGMERWIRRYNKK